MLDGPEPPFLELSFYDPGRPAIGLLQDVLDVLAGRGARAVRALVHAGVDPTLPFAGPTDLVQESISITSLSDVAAAMAQIGRLTAVDVAGALAHDPRHLARVTLCRVDDDLVGIDRNPVAIWASGASLDWGSRTVTSIGREVREVFEAVVAAVRPAYGAITEERSLLTPGEMAREPADEDYGDLYLGLPAGDPARREVIEAARGLTVVEDVDGVGVFSSPVLGGTGAPAAAAATAFAAAVRRRWAQ